MCSCLAPEHGQSLLGRSVGFSDIADHSLGCIICGFGKPPFQRCRFAENKPNAVETHNSPPERVYGWWVLVHWPIPAYHYRCDNHVGLFAHDWATPLLYETVVGWFPVSTNSLNLLKKCHQSSNRSNNVNHHQPAEINHQQLDHHSPNRSDNHQ